MTSASTTVYDSDRARSPLLSEFRNLWDYRGLLRLLVGRDLTLRYKRSTLGVWWTVLNPVLTSAVLWLVFGQLFRFETGVPYIVYLLSGVLLATLFTQAITATGSSIVDSSAVLAKVYVPPEVFAFAAATAAAANFMISLIPLLLIQLLTGTGIPLTVLLVPIPAIAMLALVAGIGLIVASAAVYFFDVLDFTTVLMTLITYLAPTFYPLSIVPDGFLWIIRANPLFSYLEVFRGFVYEGGFAPGWNFIVMGATSLVALVVGVYVFSRSWKNLVVLL